MKTLTRAKESYRFHGQADAELFTVERRTEETTETKLIIVRERDVSYALTPHFHPYAGYLRQRLLRKGTSGLQAADTEYVSLAASRPGSVEIGVAPAGNLVVSSGAPVWLTSDLQVVVGGIVTTLRSSMRMELAAPAQATAPNGLVARLIAGMNNTPADRTVFPLAQNESALVLGDSIIELTTATSVTLFDGGSATLPSGTNLVVVDGSTVTVPAGAPVTLRKSDFLPVLYQEIFSNTKYQPSELVKRPYPVRDLDFSSGGAYAPYNWELFFHVPFSIAIHLSKNQRFADAQRWFHYVFDPTDDSEGPSPERFWKVRPFQSTDIKQMEEVLINLATNGDPELRNQTVRSIESWGLAPFQPHVIARFRPQAYMYKTVMAYLDNLIAWGDSLFRQDTGETVDEALMLYTMAANILGPRPQAIPRKGSVRPQTYEQLRKDLQLFGVVLRDSEADLGFDTLPLSSEGGTNNAQLGTVRSMGRALYFSVPRNEKLLSYWDTVADRLFKIHNSLNIQGTFRQLALFEPPIDPALLVRAAAAGLDVGAIVNGLNQPLPLVRFALLAQKASEVVQEVKSLGAGLLAAMEKEDGEALAVLRAKHERAVLELVERVKYGQVQEAGKAREGLLKSLASAAQRYTFYERQLGRKPEDIEKAIPVLEELDKESLDKLKLSTSEPEVNPREIEVDIATDAFAQAAQFLAGGKLLSSHEVRETLFLEGAQISSDIAGVLGVASSVAAIVPQFEVSAEPWGMGAATTFGGQNVASGIQAAAGTARAIADRLNFEARRASRIDSFARREREWAFQSNLAAAEISQIFKQLRAAQIREAVAEHELKAHRQQMKQAQEVERFLNEDGTEKIGKKTNRSLYTWMKREVKGIYAQSFQFAFDIARKAERALQHELGDSNLRYLQFGYLAGKEGLLAGERLLLDVKRMEMAYQDLNQREYELTKHLSLLQIDPQELLRLRMTGRCTLRLPEAVFDTDGPGHYFRRVKSVALSVPCVTGPYAGVSCTLTLLKSSIRKDPTLHEGGANGPYAREDAEDGRFADHFGSLQSIVTSSAQNDAGLFETNLRDERYLPFENSGVISEWQLELPANPGGPGLCQFDYHTISDVIMHVRYTARAGGDLLRKAAVENLERLTKEAGMTGQVRLFSARHEFPSEWSRFQNHTPAPGQRFELAVSLRPEHYPYWSQGRLKSISRVELLARKDPAPPALSVYDRADRNDAASMSDSLVREAAMGELLVGAFDKIPSPPEPTGDLRLFFEDRTLADLWIAVQWSDA